MVAGINYLAEWLREARKGEIIKPPSSAIDYGNCQSQREQLPTLIKFTRKRFDKGMLPLGIGWTCQPDNCMSNNWLWCKWPQKEGVCQIRKSILASRQWVLQGVGIVWHPVLIIDFRTAGQQMCRWVDGSRGTLNHAIRDRESSLLGVMA
jgi:hypothetical protein